MATPIGHSFAAIAIYTFFARSQCFARRSWIVMAVFMAIAPDLDFVPGFIAGSPSLYHQGVTHSLGFALAVSLGAAAVCSLRGQNFFAVLGLCFTSYFSHLAIDFFGPDGRSPYGQPLFWPISNEYFISPIEIFWGMHHASSTHASRLEWIMGVFSSYNIEAIAVEVILIAPFVLLGKYCRRASQVSERLQERHGDKKTWVTGK